MKRPFGPDIEINNYCEHICNAHIHVLRQNKDTETGTEIILLRRRLY